MTDDELLRRLGELLRSSRRIESDLVAHIAEVDRRRLYAREAAPSMFAYCTEVLFLSEAEAYLRIAAARASREHPVLLSMLADGSLHLTGIALLAPHLTAENQDELIRRATHRSKRQIEELIADLAPRADAPEQIRKLPVRHASQSEAAPQAPRADDEGAEQRQGTSPVVRWLESASAATFDAPGDAADSGEADSGEVESGAPRLRPDRVDRECSRAALIEPLGLARYKVQFTASASLREKLERLQALMRHEVPDGDLAAIVDRLVTEKLECIEARRFAKTARPRTGVPSRVDEASSRRIPAAVRRAVHERDGKRCGYVNDAGKRCSEVHRLEYHHRYPFGMGGGHSVKNIGLVCRAHNAFLAAVDYGREAMSARRASTMRAGPNKRPPG